MEKLKMQTTNVVDENIKRIGELFPNCLTEILDENGRPQRAIDFDQLRQELSKDIVEGPEERYQFTWPDKRNAIRLANAPTTDTLRPCREESVDFDNTQNLYIEGDNLEVLKLLRQNYLGKVKMIYIDPPYNTGNDFVYNDEFDQDSEYYKHNSGQFDELGNRLVTNTESNGRFHTDWLNMIYPRLKVAKDLLSEDGVIFISIDDNEDCNLLKICNEVFGIENFIGQLIHQRAKGGGQAKHIVKGHDYILVYCSNSKELELARRKVIQKKVEKINGEDYIINDDVVRKVFGKYDKSMGDRRCYYEELVQYKGEAKKKQIDDDIKNGKLFLRLNEHGMHTICRYEKIGEATSKMYSILKLADDESIIKVLSEEGKKDIEKLGITGFSYPKPVDIIRQLVDAGSSKDSLILDFFSGSATTAHAVMRLNEEDNGNRKFIMVQLPEKTEEGSEAYREGYRTICDIGKERIRRAGKKIKEDNPLTTKNLDTGFRVLKLDSSNMNDVFYTPEAFTERDLFEDNIKVDRTDEDLLFQTMIELGIELSAKIEKKSIAGKTVWSVSDGYLMACFDKDVNETTIKEIAKAQPFYFVMRDASMATDNVADNFEQIWSEYSKDTVRRIL
jgi:adenine-specific DNA-methyltransferase